MDGPKSGDLLRHNIRSYLDVFSSRQLLYLHTAIGLLREYAGIDKLVLGTLVSTALEFSAMFCGYKPLVVVSVYPKNCLKVGVVLRVV